LAEIKNNTKVNILPNPKKIPFQKKEAAILKIPASLQVKTQ